MRKKAIETKRLSELIFSKNNKFVRERERFDTRKKAIETKR